jgi:hypothetical protein
LVGGDPIEMSAWGDNQLVFTQRPMIMLFVAKNVYSDSRNVKNISHDSYTYV